MKKLNFLKLLLLLFGLSVSNAQAGFLTDEEIEEAKTLATSQTKFENYKTLSSEEKDKLPKNWLTLETFSFSYKGNDQTFYVANSFDRTRGWGELALFPSAVNQQRINLSMPGEFNDIRGERYLSTLKHEYIPGTNPHIILEMLTSSYEGKGYSQACVKYFLDEFVSNRSDITHVFSDCRNEACQNYFPKYGFKEGMLPDYTFKRGMNYPYYWVKEEEKIKIKEK
jgi:hypothetical protein